MKKEIINLDIQKNQVQVGNPPPGTALNGSFLLR